MNETRPPIKKVSLIFGIVLVFAFIVTISVDEEDVFYFPGLMGFYLMFDALKDRLIERFGQKNIKVTEYILAGIVIIALAFTFYQRYIK